MKALFLALFLFSCCLAVENTRIILEPKLASRLGHVEKHVVYLQQFMPENTKGAPLHYVYRVMQEDGEPHPVELELSERQREMLDEIFESQDAPLLVELIGHEDFRCEGLLSYAPNVEEPPILQGRAWHVRQFFRVHSLRVIAH